MLNNRVILVTGGTGSFGKKFTETVFKRYRPKKLIIFSRDEFKQYEMSKIFPADKYPIRYFLGDVRDKDRLQRAFHGVDYVVHAAALKQVPALEYNPTEAMRTNVLGADNIVGATVDTGVQKVVAISTDKAVNPINLYGATKLVAEKIFVAANVYGGGKTVFSVVRYGNVVGSRGSVLPFFLDIKARGEKEYPITEPTMTRFSLTLDEGVELVLKALSQSVGGEIFVPKIPSMRIVDLVRAIDPDCQLKIIGVRPGEKIHETLISEDEARKTCSENNMYVVLPEFSWGEAARKRYEQAQRVANNFVYRSDLNDQWISNDELDLMIKKYINYG